MNNDFSFINNNSNLNILAIIDAVVTRICHDLINPIGTAQMALEQLNNEQNLETKTLIANCLEQACEKLDLFRTIFNINGQHDHAIELLYKYIKTHNLNIKIDDGTLLKTALMFFLIQKMTTKSSIRINNNEIILENIRLNEQEIQALEGNMQEINTGNVLPFLAQLIDGKTKIMAQPPSSWKIII